ncbi:MAG: hypothetical protein LBT62_07625 [Deltaproteobacteria bacterium]|nr:hypothetical protein [Deltaproteobacteria bacterium]
MTSGSCLPQATCIVVLQARPLYWPYLGFLSALAGGFASDLFELLAAAPLVFGCSSSRQVLSGHFSALDKTPIPDTQKVESC